MRRACSAIRVNGFRVCRPIIQPPTAAAISAIRTPSDTQGPSRCLRACNARARPSPSRRSGGRCSRPAVSDPELACRRRHGCRFGVATDRRQRRPIDGKPQTSRRLPSGRVTASVRSGTTTSALASAAAPSRVSPSPNSVAHDAFERGHRAREIVVQALQRKPGLRERADDRAVTRIITTTLLYQSVRRARMERG